MEENKVKLIKVPNQIILDFEKPKLIKMRDKFEKLLNSYNEKKLVPLSNATSVLIEMLKSEIEKKQIKLKKGRAK